MREKSLQLYKEKTSMPLKGNFKKLKLKSLSFDCSEHPQEKVSVVGKQPCGVIPAVKSILQLTYCFSEETAVE